MNNQITASSGRILIATVTIDSPPAARTPMALTAVRKMTQPTAIETTQPLPPNCGPMNDSADAVATATEACATQLETQNDQVARKPLVAPNSRSMFAWIPSPPNREIWASPKTMHIAPNPLITQPMEALSPSGARLTGNMKIAPPMIVPTTSADVIQKPILLSSVSVIVAFPLKESRASLFGRRDLLRAFQRLPDQEDHDP